MTLSTDIILDKFLPAEMLMNITSDILGVPDYKYNLKLDKWEKNTVAFWGIPGQGAPAWIITKDNAGKPLARDLDEDSDIIEPLGYSFINLDTGYSYNDDGAGCSDLHAFVIKSLIEWPFDTSVNINWQNEFTGEWFKNLNGLEEFGDPERIKL